MCTFGVFAEFWYIYLKTVRITSIEFSHDSSMVAVTGWDGCWHLYRKVSVNVIVRIKCLYTDKRMFEKKEIKAKNQVNIVWQLTKIDPQTLSIISIKYFMLPNFRQFKMGH